MMHVRTPEPSGGSGLVLGQTAVVLSLNALVAEIAKTNIPVLLVGESGTGKEVYARWLHRLSGHDETLLKKLNCASLGPEQLVGELQRMTEVGTSSVNGLPRTLFLDGVHELDVACQKALLSILPDGESGPQREKVLERLICTSTPDLEKEVEGGRFRRELYFRISGAILNLPPLRERKEDIPALIEYFLFKHARESGKSVPELSRETRNLLRSYDWPGNIRELENLTRKIVAVGDSRIVLGDVRLRFAGLPALSEVPQGSSLKVAARAASRRAERELILQALERTHWNRKRAARELQISYKALLYKIKQIGVQVSGTREI